MNTHRFYIYLHRRNDTNEVFYVGKGMGVRAKSLTGRTTAWHEIVKEAGGYSVEYYDTSLTNDEAVALENHYLSNPNVEWNLINHAGPSVVKPIDKGTIDVALYYDETSPSCLRWKVAAARRTKVGSVAGYLNQGYWKIELNNKSMLAHRAIVILHGMTLDSTTVVDHINGNSSDNRISNLRCTTLSGNCRSARKRSDNTSGVHGVNYNSTQNSWCAQWYDLDGKKRIKTFLCKSHGFMPAFTRACEWREQKIKELNEQGAGYTERHGT